MQLKVGELARSSGLTVRTLHHYDEIGLLKPSGRSDSGYRLYSEKDVARLHGIQALRHLGLPLGDIGALLDGDAASPERILDQQMQALDLQIAQATELRGRLSLIRDGLMQGDEPEAGDWLRALALMATYGKYFSAAELKTIFSGWHKIEVEWPALLAEVRAFMDAGGEPHSPQAQVLARRWMGLVHHWMGGDFELMNRWGDMYRREPGAHGRQGGPPTDMLEFMQQAVERRTGVLQQYFDMSELARFRYVPEAEWRAVNEAGLQLLRQGESPDGREARALAAKWSALLDRLVGGDAVLRAKLIDVMTRDPVAQSGSATAPEVRAFFLEALKNA